MKRFVVCKVSELPRGGRKIIDADGKSIGVFNVHGDYFALRNTCPHQFAPLCEGKITGHNATSPVGEYRWCREGEIIRCPWHGWEFDIKTGQSIFNPHRVRTKAYEAGVEPEEPDEEDPSVEQFPVEVEKGVVVVYA